MKLHFHMADIFLPSRFLTTPRVPEYNVDCELRYNRNWTDARFVSSEANEFIRHQSPKTSKSGWNLMEVREIRLSRRISPCLADSS